MNADREHTGRSFVTPGLLLASTLVMGGCDGLDGLLDVDLPGEIVEESIRDPSSAQILINSAISNVECGYSNFISSSGSGPDDVYTRVTGWGWDFEYDERPGTGSVCNPSDTNSGSWWSPLQAGRYTAELAYELISGWTVEQVPAREQLLVQSAIYAAIVYNLLGDYFCEVAVEAGPLMSPDETLGKAEEWLTTALDRIAETGDSPMPYGIASSSREMAQLLRARVRWARGDFEGAASDAREISVGFKAYVTRDGGGERDRWNRVFEALNGSGWGTVNPAIDWWDGPGEWPDTIPFTGYRHLGVLPDGRAIEDDPEYPITTTAYADAVPDPRVPVVDEGRIFNGFPQWEQRKYTSLDAPIVLANWEETHLILAEIEGGQDAIDRVNEIRRAYQLPEVTYLSPDDDDGIRDLIIEERRRSLFLEGRFWATKLRNEDKLWFPRGVGRTLYPYPYNYGVRMLMPLAEYEQNPNFDLSAQGTLCGNQAPANL